MKYILVLGIEYKKYKKPASVSLHIGEKFIDKFELYQDYSNATQMPLYIESYWFNVLNKSSWLDKPRGLRTWQDMPKFFKIYEINDDDLKGVLKVQVKNSNNDYTNGFMKNSSVIKLSIVALFPKEFTVNKGEKLMKICSKMDDAYRVRYLKNGSNGHLQKRWTWPIIDSFYVKRHDEKFEKSEIKDVWFWIGGDFTVEFQIKKKHKLKFLYSSQYQPKGFPNTSVAETLTISSCRPLLNIYNEN